jgi:predicted transcriptional regulator
MKHGEGKEEARDLYCYQQMTFDEIAKRTGRSEKTIRVWAEADGWKQARSEIVSTRASTREKLHTLVEKITDRMIRDCEDETDLSPQSLHALTNLISAIKNMYSYESKAKNEELPAACETQATPEEIAAKVAEIMGA